MQSCCERRWQILEIRRLLLRPVPEDPSHVSPQTSRLCSSWQICHIPTANFIQNMSSGHAAILSPYAELLIHTINHICSGSGLKLNGTFPLFNSRVVFSKGWVWITELFVSWAVEALRGLFQSCLSEVFLHGSPRPFCISLSCLIFCITKVFINTLPRLSFCTSVCLLLWAICYFICMCTFVDTIFQLYYKIAFWEGVRIFTWHKVMLASRHNFQQEFPKGRQTAT